MKCWTCGRKLKKSREIILVMVDAAGNRYKLCHACMQDKFPGVDIRLVE